MYVFLGITQILLEVCMLWFGLSSQYFGVAYVLLIMWLGVNFVFRLPEVCYVNGYNISRETLIGVNIVNPIRIFNIFCIFPRVGASMISIIIVIHTLLCLVSIGVFWKLDCDMKGNNLYWKYSVFDLNQVIGKGKIIDLNILPYTILVIASEQVMIKIFAKKILFIRIIAIILAMLMVTFLARKLCIEVMEAYRKMFLKISMICISIASVLLLLGFSNISILFVYIQLVKWLDILIYNDLMYKNT